MPRKQTLEQRRVQMQERIEQVYAEIVRYSDQHGYAPTVRELAAATGINSTSLMSGYLDVLMAQGRIRRVSKSARTIVLTGR